MSPRPRSKDPHIPVSVSLPRSMALKIDEQLGPMGSRSAWIAKAVRERLEKSVGLATVRSKSLLIELLCREDLDDQVLRHQIEQFLQR